MTEKLVAGVGLAIVVIVGLAVAFVPEVREPLMSMFETEIFATLEDATGCTEFRNECGFIRSDVATGSGFVEKQRFDGTTFQSPVFVITALRDTCLIMEFENKCVTEIFLDSNRYSFTGKFFEGIEVIIFERDTFKDSMSASVVDFENECRLTKPRLQCEGEALFCDPETKICSIP